MELMERFERNVKFMIEEKGFTQVTLAKKLVD